MPASLYESLVREYLETEGYLVYNNLKVVLTGKNKSGRKTQKEIDIFAYIPVKGAIIGEVKTLRPNEDVVQKMASKLNRKAIGVYLKKEYGVNKFELALYCWNLYGEDLKIRNKAKELGFDQIVTYPQIVRALFENVKKSREQDRWFYDINRPNTVLLQIIYDALSFQSRYLSVKDFE